MRQFLLKKILLQRRVVVIFYWPNILKCHKILLICLFEIISFLEKKHFRNHFIWDLNIFWSASKFSTVTLNSGNGRFELLTLWRHKFTIQNHIWPWNRMRIVQNNNLSILLDKIWKLLIEVSEAPQDDSKEILLCIAIWSCFHFVSFLYHVSWVKTFWDMALGVDKSGPLFIYHKNKSKLIYLRWVPQLKYKWKYNQINGQHTDTR